MFATVGGGSTEASREARPSSVWTALTFLDPLLAALLLARVRGAVAALGLLMLADVLHNTWIVHTRGGLAWMVVDQWVFFAFVLCTARGVTQAERHTV